MDHFPPVTLNSRGKLEQFEIIEQVGEGTYGRVFKAIHRTSRKVVALKRIPIAKKLDGVTFTAIREINNLIQLSKCKNIVVMHDSFLQDGELVIVLEFCEYDLSALLSVPGAEFGAAQAKYYLKQVLEACHQCHSHGLMHRDVKAANVLINRDGQLKLADLGLMTTFDRTMQHSNHVVTLWYRAPELLLGEACYGPAVDLWSVGCVMVEIFTRHSPFPGRNDPEQLDLISQVCGTPTEETYPGVEKTPAFAKLLQNKTVNQRKLRQIYASRMSEEALDLLERLLTLDPRRRIKAQEALRHPFFSAAPAVPDIPPRITAFESIHEYQVKMKRKLAAEKSADTAAAAASFAVKRAKPTPENPPASARPPVGTTARSSSTAPNGHAAVSPQASLRNSHQPTSNIRSAGFSPSVLRASSADASKATDATPTATAGHSPASASGSASSLVNMAVASKSATEPTAMELSPAVPPLQVIPAPKASTSTSAPIAEPVVLPPPANPQNPYLMPARKRSQIAH